jgi:hypothetical protein
MEIEKLIADAHRGITRTKGKEYAPTATEIQAWLDNKNTLMEIKTDEELLLWILKGFHPLLGRSKKVDFIIDPLLRWQTQKRMFPKNNQKTNAKFYRWAWDYSENHSCEECGKELPFSPIHISHILTRGAHPELAYDIRNINILCFEHHVRWEGVRKKEMSIYDSNQERIEMMLQEMRELEKITEFRIKSYL